MFASGFGASSKILNLDAADFPTHESSQVLLVSVHNIIYPITEYVLHRVFDPYGYVKKIDILQASELLQATIQFDSCQSAVWAKKQLQGRYIYDRCCQLDIQFYKKIDYEDKTENLLMENEFALDLDFIRNKLLEMMAIIERMQDRIKSRNSSCPFPTAATASTTPPSPLDRIKPDSAPPTQTSILTPLYVVNFENESVTHQFSEALLLDAGGFRKVSKGDIEYKSMKVETNKGSLMLDQIRPELDSFGVIFFVVLYIRPVLNPTSPKEQEWTNAHKVFAEMNNSKCERKILIFDPGGDIFNATCFFAIWPNHAGYLNINGHGNKMLNKFDKCISDLEDKVDFEGMVMIWYCDTILGGSLAQPVPHTPICLNIAASRPLEAYVLFSFYRLLVTLYGSSMLALETK